MVTPIAHGEQGADGGHTTLRPKAGTQSQGSVWPQRRTLQRLGDSSAQSQLRLVSLFANREDVGSDRRIGVLIH